MTCWLHKWEYYGERLRTCMKCGVHQNNELDFEGGSFGWDSIGCKEYAEKVDFLKKAQYELAVEQGKFRKEQMSCKHYNHKDNKPKVRLMPSMMVIREKAEEE